MSAERVPQTKKRGQAEQPFGAVVSSSIKVKDLLSKGQNVNNTPTATTTREALKQRYSGKLSEEHRYAAPHSIKVLLKFFVFIITFKEKSSSSSG